TVHVGFAEPGAPARPLAPDPRAGRGQVAVLATALGEPLHALIAAVAPRRAAHDDLAGDHGHARGYHEVPAAPVDRLAGRRQLGLDVEEPDLEPPAGRAALAGDGEHSRLAGRVRPGLVAVHLTMRRREAEQPAAYHDDLTVPAVQRVVGDQGSGVGISTHVVSRLS